MNIIVLLLLGIVPGSSRYETAEREVCGGMKEICGTMRWRNYSTGNLSAIVTGELGIVEVKMKHYRTSRCGKDD